MCGIVGQVRCDGRPVERPLLERMCAALEHRGPDARGIRLASGAGLGIQRLRVVDLETGDQPIANEDGTVVVVLNGEIYNYRELRDGLRRRGHTLTTRGDTEVIVHLYEEHGPGCVHHLHGMFAFALWDSRRRRLLVARDRVGKKPLHYAVRPGCLSLASELGALLSDPEVSREIDLPALDRYLAYGYVPAPRSAFRAVRKLPPGHLLLWQEGRLDVRRWWRLEPSTESPPAGVEEAKERVRAAIDAAVRRRMVADVPLGAFLSGGIDSSAVVAAMARASDRPVRTFSIGFGSGDFDELPYARMVAERFGTDHHELVVEPASLDLLPTIARHHGEPFADSSAVPSFVLASLARRHVTVALNGDGGDESFGGYTRYAANALAARLDRLPRRLRSAISAAGGRLPASGSTSGAVNRARRLAHGLAATPAERYAGYMAIFDAREREALWRPELRAELGPATAAVDVIADAWDEAAGADVVDTMLHVDATTYLPGDLIAKIDIATMAHGLEARSPLLDHHVMQLAAALPADLKVRGRQKKWILREALRGTVPDVILDRPKQGFQVPIADWFRGSLNGWVREVLLDPATLARGWFARPGVEDLLDRHAAGRGNEEHRIWALLMLELWQRECVDRAAGAHAAAA